MAETHQSAGTVGVGGLLPTSAALQTLASSLAAAAALVGTSSIPPRWPVKHGRPATRTAKEHVKSLKVLGREKRLSRGKGQASEEEEEPASAESFNLFVFFSGSCLQLRMMYARTTLFVVSLNCIVIILLSFLLILPYYDNDNNLLSDSFLI